jgi:glucokinase
MTHPVADQQPAPGINTLAIDIGGTKFSLALFQNSQIRLRQTRATWREGGRAWMLDQIVSIAKGWRRGFEFELCGVGFGGPVDFAQQRVAVSNVVADWNEFPLASYLHDQLSIPTVIDNDANLGGLGEAVYGAGAGCDPLFYVTLSTGIGGGLITNGRVFHGADSFAGEIGHIPVCPDGPRCGCGANGCLERMCSGFWIEHDHGKTAKELLADPAFVRRYVVNLAHGLKSAILLLNPARVVIGGGISKAADALFLPLREELKRQITAWSRARIDVVPAALGDDSVLYGALVIAQPAAKPAPLKRA